MMTFFAMWSVAWAFSIVGILLVLPILDGKLRVPTLFGMVLTYPFWWIWVFAEILLHYTAKYEYDVYQYVLDEQNGINEQNRWAHVSDD